MPVLDTLRLVGSGESNRAMEAELKRLGRRGVSGWREAKPKRADGQTLVYPWSDDLGWLVVNHMRTPSRALHDLFEAQSTRLEPLYDEVRSWIIDEARPWFRDGLTISVRAREIREFPASASQIQGTVKNAIVEGAADRAMHVRLDAEQPDVMLSVRGGQGPLVISLDLAGRSLHERGYRLNRVQAPLRENLAAQILMLARWDQRHEVLVDPMCGSGTFAAEAAGMALGAPLWVPPAAPDAARWSEFADRAPPGPLYADAQPVIIANDQHTPALDAARRNVERAGADEHVLFTHGDFRDLTFDRMIRSAKRQRPNRWPENFDPSRGLIVCNPPYGERLSGDPTELYDDLANWALEFGDGWRAAFLVADPGFERAFGRQPKLKKPLSNGPIKTTLFVFDLR